MNRYVLVGLAGAAAFIVCAILLLNLMPRPTRPVDFLMTGAISTMVALAVVFVGVMITFKQGEVLFKKKKKP